ncbi:hypothetical protein BpHYR1_053159 [Brachionus plicatilis]|uniref:Uncharacterized protein n=1 Tax=Brachionus plicatilis TaxID=10195 RepID=A0A3M7PPB0_BRAPC|nr:hypothetical protein BpHYR1_053159 [Brachionus plicatilis]
MLIWSLSQELIINNVNLRGQEIGNSQKAFVYTGNNKFIFSAACDFEYFILNKYLTNIKLDIFSFLLLLCVQNLLLFSLSLLLKTRFFTLAPDKGHLVWFKFSLSGS